MYVCWKRKIYIRTGEWDTDRHKVQIFPHPRTSYMFVKLFIALSRSGCQLVVGCGYVFHTKKCSPKSAQNEDQNRAPGNPKVFSSQVLSALSMISGVKIVGCASQIDTCHSTYLLVTGENKYWTIDLNVFQIAIFPLKGAQFQSCGYRKTFLWSFLPAGLPKIGTFFSLSTFFRSAIVVTCAPYTRKVWAKNNDPQRTSVDHVCVLP